MEEFETIKEAEEYYFSKLAKHNEDEEGFDRWLQNIKVKELE